MAKYYLTVIDETQNSIAWFQIEPNEQTLWNISKRNLNRIDQAETKRALLVINKGKIVSVDKEPMAKHIDVYLENVIPEDRFYKDGYSKILMKAIFEVEYK